MRSLLFNFLNLNYFRAVDELYKRVKSIPLDQLTEEEKGRVVNYVFKHNSFYKKFFGSEPRLEDLPLLTKKIIRENFKSLESFEKRKGIYKNSSGGSTGEPISLIQDLEYSLWSGVTEKFYHRDFLGVDYEAVKKVVLWGSERDVEGKRSLMRKFYNWTENTIFLNSFCVDQVGWFKYVDIINRCQPYFIKGYAGSLFEMAKFIRRENLKVYRPKFLYSAAEYLRDFMRKEIEEVFGAKVYDFYGSREVGQIAGECKKGAKHIFTFNNFVEVVDFEKDVPASKGDLGRIVVSNLHNYSMPLLRYEIGDVGALSFTKCSCGSSLPWLKELRGRITDCFVTKGSGLVHGEYFTHLFYYRDWVEKFQVIQKDYDFIEILLVLAEEGRQRKTEMIEVESKIRQVMGKDCEIKWSFVDSISSIAQGKFLYTKSHLV